MTTRDPHSTANYRPSVRIEEKKKSRDEEPPDGQPPDGEPMTGAGATDAPEMTLNGLFEVARNQRRRHILEYLENGGGAVPIGDLAEHLAELEYDCPDTGPTSTQRKRMYVGLYQGHLPKMDEMGVVAFDKDRGQAAPGPHTRRVLRFVERAGGDGHPWAVVYLGESLLALGLLILSGTGPAPPGIATVLLGAVLGLLVCTGVVHLQFVTWPPGR